MQILFEPNYSPGDTVHLRINPEKKMVIERYIIYGVNAAGEVTDFTYSMYDAEGITYQFKELDIELYEKYEGKRK